MGGDALFSLINMNPVLYRLSPVHYYVEELNKSILTQCRMDVCGLMHYASCMKPCLW